VIGFSAKETDFRISMTTRDETTVNPTLSHPEKLNGPCNNPGHCIVDYAPGSSFPELMECIDFSQLLQ
jgi:hypothetical protein